MTLYDILDLAPDASADKIKAQYRILAMHHHPDRGGDPEKFKTMKEAYEVLSDPERRAKYDATGETSAPDMLRQKAEHLVASTLVALLANADEELDGRASMFDLVNQVTNPVRAASTRISEAISKNLVEQEKAKKAMRRMLRSLMRISRRGDGVNLVADLIRQQIKQTEVFLVEAAEEVNVFRLALEVLADYKYDRSKDVAPETSAAPLQLES